jgi:hypothetical protein
MEYCRLYNSQGNFTLRHHALICLVSCFQFSFYIAAGSYVQTHLLSCQMALHFRANWKDLYQLFEVRFEIFVKFQCVITILNFRSSICTASY